MSRRACPQIRRDSYGACRQDEYNENGHGIARVKATRRSRGSINCIPAMKSNGTPNAPSVARSIAVDAAAVKADGLGRKQVCRHDPISEADGCPCSSTGGHEAKRGEEPPGLRFQLSVTAQRIGHADTVEEAARELKPYQAEGRAGRHLPRDQMASPRGSRPGCTWVISARPRAALRGAADRFFVPLDVSRIGASM